MVRSISIHNRQFIQKLPESPEFSFFYRARAKTRATRANLEELTHQDVANPIQGICQKYGLIWPKTLKKKIGSVLHLGIQYQVSLLFISIVLNLPWDQLLLVDCYHIVYRHSQSHFNCFEISRVARVARVFNLAFRPGRKLGRLGQIIVKRKKVPSVVSNR